MYGWLLPFNVNYSFNLPDVQVEVAEMRDPPQGTPVPASGPGLIKGPYDRMSFIGASIGPPIDPATGIGRCGTLGCFLSAMDGNGNAQLLALTCEHVVFTLERPCKGK